MQDIEEKGLTPDLWIFLSTICGDKLVKSTKNILTKESITKNFARTTHRELWTVSSSKSSANYIIISPKAFHCSCQAFKNNTLLNHTSPFCKHILTVYICKALYKNNPNTTQFVSNEIDDEAFARYLEKVFYDSEREPK
ncbi:SWIM zinc finger family protein [Trichomonas vaginalis G3]|uniref:SWIM zinc finger family protein n=1 Tax=Trichomonas vaginalis (strain ATCC PRA-98 / G3) TaxID=412133 RepID=A2DGS3_TRIV3|nr:zinc finger SWIM domain-containing protein 7 family [Trichomonas vaginalis G3]EAY20460.1 SWIM zinc finger family protein [Trichomonas vaginalis G3]KAI5490490.1 zinc finger SWIM domain-containing protein 7 family [Trichomonas vaginalis G3]|eukprot:XP_001581446.1 SWIM zinc finger family protein [Trichomonas vaginalis G3]